MTELFIDGVKDALTLVKPIFTTLMAFMLFVGLFAVDQPDKCHIIQTFV